MKDDAIATKFNPSTNQVEFLKQAVALGTYKNKTKIAEEANVHRTRWYEWVKQIGFIEWFYEEFTRGIKALVFELDVIGFEKAKNDFRFWEAMQKKYGGLPDGKTGVNVSVKATANVSSKPEVEIGTEEASNRLRRNLSILKRHGFDYIDSSEK